MPIGSSFICFLAFWHVTHTEVYSLTPLKFNLGWLNTHVEVYITLFSRVMKNISIRNQKKSITLHRGYALNLKRS